MRTADLVVALVLLVLAGLVAWEALRLDIGWGLNGPAGGFFPFWLAVGLALCSLVTLVRALWPSSPASWRPLVARSGWTPFLKVAGPAVGLVLLTEVIGLYFAAALYIGFSMRWLGKHSWLSVLVVSIGIPLGSYFLFDKWFLIPMPRGWWGAHLGL
jgi:hypothetical protein